MNATPSDLPPMSTGRETYPVPPQRGQLFGSTSPPQLLRVLHQLAKAQSQKQFCYEMRTRPRALAQPRMQLPRSRTRAALESGTGPAMTPRKVARENSFSKTAYCASWCAWCDVSMSCSIQMPIMKGRKSMRNIP